MMYNNNFTRTPQILSYNREKAVQYAHKWALGRNPEYFNFEKIGGDCTSFASQVIYAGSEVMNYTKTFGWYYLSSYSRTPSWSGVDFLHNFLIGNKSLGPFGEIVDVKDIEIGDVIQLSFQDGPRFNHSPVVVKTGTPANISNILVAAHTFDRDHYPITNYNWVKIRCIHILGVRK